VIELLLKFYHLTVSVGKTFYTLGGSLKGVVVKSFSFLLLFNGEFFRLNVTITYLKLLLNFITWVWTGLLLAMAPLRASIDYQGAREAE